MKELVSGFKQEKKYFVVESILTSSAFIVTVLIYYV